MNHLMTKEESYVERRKLFKNVWDTSMLVGENDDIMMKPKIIKTLRLDEMDRTTAGRKKKQKIKNLRAVCNKLLDFCDRQDADDLFYEQMASQDREQLKPEVETSNMKKKKPIRAKRRITKANSTYSPKNEETLTRAVTSERKEDFLTEKQTSRYTSPLKFKRQFNDKISNGFPKKQLSKSKQIPRVKMKSNLSDDVTHLTKTIVKNGQTKRKKSSLQYSPPGRTSQYKYSFPPFKPPNTKKQLLQLKKVTIS